MNKTISPQQKYKAAVTSGQYESDEQQKKAILALQHVYNDVHIPRFLGLFKKSTQGVYLWGAVGAGKTWLMDLFYESLTGVGKKRSHFHEFMKEIHQQLKQLQGFPRPLTMLAKKLAKEIKILCFDEFTVNDIADAMLLAGLLKALFKEGIILVTTSNTPPDQLYWHGIQRERFLPAIDLIKQHTAIIHLESKKDYRLRTLEKAGVYHFPLNSETEQKMQKHFFEIVGNHGQREHFIEINERKIPTIAVGNQLVWFDFKDLCHIPRSQNDYLAITKQFKIVMLSNVPKFSQYRDNEALFFIHLIDVFYDAKTKLILSAAVPIQELYTSGRWKTIFQRTLSRLIEMQSHYYLNNHTS